MADYTARYGDHGLVDPDRERKAIGSLPRPARACTSSYDEAAAKSFYI